MSECHSAWRTPLFEFRQKSNLAALLEFNDTKVKCRELNCRALQYHADSEQIYSIVHLSSVALFS
jgi:hypothetical protein